MTATVVSVERVIKAPAASIFAVVADAARHPEIDGSGALVAAKAGAPERLAMGSTFGMSMKLGVPYTTSNTVVEFEQDRRIAWQTVHAGRARPRASAGASGATSSARSTAARW